MITALKRAWWNRPRRRVHTCTECGHESKHYPQYGCSQIVVCGPWECPDPEPCMCTARKDWDLSDVIEAIMRPLRRVYSRFQFDEEALF